MSNPNSDPNDPASSEAPYPGSQRMPRWNVGELPPAPIFTMRNWAGMLGPGILMGAMAIGGGEWLLGPMVTARYGGALLWLAGLSILGQLVYNIEISRYTLYSGEPIFAGKFRTFPGPMFWVIVYLILDMYMFFPYLPASAATPLAALVLGKVPDPEQNEVMLKCFAVGLFLISMIPLMLGGKIYNVLKYLMTFKLVFVMGFLLIVAVLFSHMSTWTEIFSGFVKVGHVPIRRAEDVNQNGALDPGEDWDLDGRLDGIEPSLAMMFDTNNDGLKDATDIDQDQKPDPMVTISRDGKDVRWPDLDGDGQADASIEVDGVAVPLDRKKKGHLDSFLDVDNDGTRDGDNVDNVFLAILQGRPLPPIDLSMIGLVCAMAAIAGGGGLGNTAISNYTRDQGWGMGSHVGAIPSIVGGRGIQLSHSGTVFPVTQDVLPRWKRWYRHVVRDQCVVWFPACFFGMALPAMLSVEFLKRGAVLENQWLAAVMTADGVKDRAGLSWGPVFWFLTIFCGFIVLAPSIAPATDGFIRRWVDVFWISSRRLRSLDTRNIRYVYFGVLAVYMVSGAIVLVIGRPVDLLKIATMIMNFALGISCWHALYVNVTLLPREVRPGWFMRIALFLAGLFFGIIGLLSTLFALGKIG